MQRRCAYLRTGGISDTLGSKLPRSISLNILASMVETSGAPSRCCRRGGYRSRIVVEAAEGDVLFADRSGKLHPAQDTFKGDRRTDEHVSRNGQATGGSALLKRVLRLSGRSRRR